MVYLYILHAHEILNKFENKKCIQWRKNYEFK